MPFAGDGDFGESYKQVKNAYYPQAEYSAACAEYLRQEIIGGLADWHRSVPTMRKALLGECSGPCRYALMQPSGSKTVEMLPIPFMEVLHEYFLKRDVEPEPPTLKTVQQFPDEFTRLEPPQPEDPQATKAVRSKNAGNFNHFTNVVAIAARLVKYFSRDERGAQLLTERFGFSPQEADQLVYAQLEPLMSDAEAASVLLDDRRRILLLMFGAFYHDLGKVITDSRHSMEGANLLLSRGVTPPAQLGAIFAKELGTHGSAAQPLERCWVAHLANLLRFHDLFGTLSTGEQAYTALVEAVAAVKETVVAAHPRSESERKLWCRRYLFDLWMLNVADVISSISRADMPSSENRDKLKPQPEWHTWASSLVALEDFFRENAKSSSFIHDLRLAFKLADKHAEDTHADSEAQLQQAAVQATARHVVDRLTRLVSETLIGVLSKRTDGQGQSVRPGPPDGVLSKSTDGHGRGVPPTQPDGVLEPDQFRKELLAIATHQNKLRGIVLECIESGGDYGELCRRVGRIGQMDYVLGYLHYLASTALKEVLGENAKATHWISTRKDTAATVNASFFLENFSAIVIDMVRYIVFRNEYRDHITHLEFQTARNHLTDERCLEMLAMVGPYRASKTRKLVLETVLYW